MFYKNSDMFEKGFLMGKTNIFVCQSLSPKIRTRNHLNIKEEYIIPIGEAFDSHDTSQSYNFARKSTLLRDILKIHPHPNFSKSSKFVVEKVQHFFFWRIFLTQELRSSELFHSNRDTFRQEKFFRSQIFSKFLKISLNF